MMSEYYDHYHRWEPLAEFHFSITDDDSNDDEDYVYCLCSRVFLRDGLKTYFVDKDASESDVEVLRDSQSQEWEDQSHVHFSLDTSYKVRCEKDEGASCYCSASHTDNYCSTDEHDPAQIQGMPSHALQPSDSGADLTYQDCHSDYTTLDHEKMDQDFPTQNIVEVNENYLSENTWEQFWAMNGERIIWASWIKKYSDYINPAYLNENNELVLDENSLPKQHSADQIFAKDKTELSNVDESMRERKFSYDSKVNPYKKNHSETVDKSNVNNEKDDTWLPLARKRSCSEHDRIISPRTVITGTDSMTNVTKMTLSSYDVTSSHVTSDSSPTEDYSVSSSTSDDQSNDQTRIANVNESIDQTGSEELDTEEYWQFLWKKHFGEQYALHYANYIECYNNQQKDLPEINVEVIPEEPKVVDEKVVDIECENSEGNSQEMPTIIEVKEVEEKVDKIKLEDKVKKPRSNKKNKKVSKRYMGSVGVLLQSLLQEAEQKKSELDEVFEAGEEGDGDDTGKTSQVDATKATDVAIPQNVTPVSNSFTPYSYDDGDDDPPEEKPASLKRSHEIDEEEIAAEKIQSTFQIMGFCLNGDEMPKGQLVYRRRLTKLRPPRSRKLGVARKTYFDDDGNPYQSQESNEEKEMQTDEEAIDKVDTDHKETNSSFDVLNKSDETIEDNSVVEAANVELPPETLSDGQEENSGNSGNPVVESSASVVEQPKRRRRNKRPPRDAATADLSLMPAELRDHPNMHKYWKKRHSLFYRFDEGIKLDLESWFSVTPENVAAHIADKCAYDVVIDAFCGAGGNAIQFARTCKNVIAIDIDPVKISLARHNARVYGVEENIRFMVGDYFDLAPGLHGDLVFLSPPWGGPGYRQNYEYDLETMLQPKPASELMAVSRKITSNIALYLPRNTRTDQLLALAKDIGGSLEIEQSYLDRRFVAITAYFYD